MSGTEQFPSDIYAEPPADVHTLNNLGPLRPLAGVWEGIRGMDTKPKRGGPRKQVCVKGGRVGVRARMG